MTSLNFTKETIISNENTTAQFLMNNISKFAEQHILVMGDFILDAYIHGSSVRVCPEAPVPVVDAHWKKYFLGGAANAAINAAQLGAQTDLCTLLGSDYVGSRGYQLLKSAGIDVKGVCVMKNKKTQYKTRIIAGDQMLVRMDKGDRKPPDKETYASIKSFLSKKITQYHAVLIADYDKGFFNQQIIDLLQELRRQHRFFLAIDSKRLPEFSTLKPDLVKPNREEASRLLNAPIAQYLRDVPDIHAGHGQQASRDINQFKKIGHDLYLKTAAQKTALTLDNEGAVWFEKGHPIHFQPAEKISDPQVSGAGDCYIATALLGSLSGLPVKEAAKIATLAASIVIAKQDTASCSLNELKNALSGNQKALMNREAIRLLAKASKNTGRSIILTNGCYDLLHNGHIDFLKASSRLGDTLVVAINTDEEITKIKGPGRPINNLNERIALLSALSFVDYIIPFGGSNYPTIDSIIQTLQPVLFTKGENYRYQIMTEQAFLKSQKIPLVFIPTVTDKTTGKLIQKIKSVSSYAI